MLYIKHDLSVNHDNSTLYRLKLVMRGEIDNLRLNMKILMLKEVRNILTIASLPANFKQFRYIM